MTVEEMQERLDGQFPDGAHIAVQRQYDSPTLYLCPRPFFVSENKILLLQDGDPERGAIHTFSEVRESNGTVHLTDIDGEEGLDIVINHNFIPTDAIKQRRKELMDLQRDSLQEEDETA